MLRNTPSSNPNLEANYSFKRASTDLLYALSVSVYDLSETKLYQSLSERDTLT